MFTVLDRDRRPTMEPLASWVRQAAPALPWWARGIPRRLGDAGRAWVATTGPKGRGLLEIGFSTAIAGVAVLLTQAVVATLLPAGAAVGGVAVAFLSLCGALSGYAAWRWIRWMRSRAERMPWSVVAALGAATTASELYGAADLAAAHSGLVERLTALAGFGLFAAATVALTGVASLLSYQRSVTDQQLGRWVAERRRRWLAAPDLLGI
jgi:hypothetical protein